MLPQDLDYFAVQKEWLDFRRVHVSRCMRWFHVQTSMLMVGCLGIVCSALMLLVNVLHIMDTPITSQIVWGLVATFVLSILFCVVRQLGLGEAREAYLLRIARRKFFLKYRQYRRISWIQELVNRRYLT